MRPIKKIKKKHWNATGKPKKNKIKKLANTIGV